MPEADEAPKIHIDSDWKAQAQAEKEKLSQQEKQTAPLEGADAVGGKPGQTPPASMEMLISTTATQALFALGLIPDPSTGQRFQSLELARHHIDMLTLLEEKTKGNLTEQEGQLLKQTTFELRQHYIRVASAAR